VKLSRRKDKKVSNSPDNPTDPVPITKTVSAGWPCEPPLREPQADVFGEIQTIRLIFILKQVFI
jgi:hypothetical protein